MGREELLTVHGEKVVEYATKMSALEDDHQLLIETSENNAKQQIDSLKAEYEETEIARADEKALLIETSENTVRDLKEQIDGLKTEQQVTEIDHELLIERSENTV